MSRFRSQFKRGGAISLVRQFGEDITYFPGGYAPGRDIQAIIERNIEVPNELGSQTAQAIVCRVLDSNTLGISSDEIDDARDSVSLQLFIGGEYETREITLMSDDSNGMVRFMVR